MSKIEIIYVKQPVNEAITAKPHISIHPNKKAWWSTRINVVRFVSLLVIVTILIGACGFVAHDAGFLPIKEFLGTQKPIGEGAEINIHEYMRAYPELKNIPKLARIKYKVYGTDASMNAVANAYRQKLEENRYSLKYEGTEDGRGMSFRYYGFVKGITAVGIILTSDAKKLFGYDTIVLYTTGNILYYKEIIDWCEENQGFLL